MFAGLNSIPPELLQYLQMMQQQTGNQDIEGANRSGPMGSMPMGMPANPLQQVGQNPGSYSQLAAMLGQNQTPGIGSLLQIMQGLNSPYLKYANRG